MDLIRGDFDGDDLGPAIFALGLGGELCGSEFWCLWGVYDGVSFGGRPSFSVNDDGCRYSPSRSRCPRTHPF